MEARGEALWALVLIGWFAFDVAVLCRAPPYAPPPVPPVGEFEDLSARDLRRLPGIGEVKALAIARERWRRLASSEPLVLDELPGIGPVTVERIEQALREAKTASSGASPQEELDAPSR